MKHLTGFALLTTALLLTMLISGYAEDRPLEIYVLMKTDPESPEQMVKVYVDYVEPRDPETPWCHDPDISAIQDKRIVALWEDIIISYRRNHPTGATVRGLDDAPEFIAEPNTPENREILIDALSLALSADPVDWNYVLTVLVLMQKGMAPDLRITQLADRLFTARRNEEMSYDHGECIRTMYRVLKRQKTKEAAELLYRACSRDYWGEDPMLTLSFSEKWSKHSIITVRKFALSCLSEDMPPGLSIPLLEELASVYPDSYVPPDIIVQPADGLRSERRIIIDFSRSDIEEALEKAYKKQAAEESGN